MWIPTNQINMQMQRFGFFVVKSKSDDIHIQNGITKAKIQLILENMGQSLMRGHNAAEGVQKVQLFDIYCAEIFPGVLAKDFSTDKKISSHQRIFEKIYKKKVRI